MKRELLCLRVDKQLGQDGSIQYQVDLGMLASRYDAATRAAGPIAHLTLSIEERDMPSAVKDGVPWVVGRTYALEIAE